MHVPYNTTSMSGFIRTNSIQTGRLYDTQMPVVKFQVVSGNQPHPVFVLEVKLAVEVYAWYEILRRRKTEKLYVAISASIVSNDTVSIMVANFIDFHASNPELRVEVERCREQMLTGKSSVLWPECAIKMPVQA
jgi:hypothetical protein